MRSVEKSPLSERQEMSWSRCKPERGHLSFCYLIIKSCLTFWWPQGLYPARLLCPWDFPSKNTGVGCHFPLQGIFPTQESNLHLLHWQVCSLPPEPPGKVSSNCPRSSQQTSSQGLLAWNMPDSLIYIHHQQRVWASMTDLALSGLYPSGWGWDERPSKPKADWRRTDGCSDPERKGGWARNECRVGNWQTSGPQIPHGCRALSTRFFQITPKHPFHVL